MDMDIDNDIDPRISALAYRDLQAKCKDLGLPARGTTQVLQKNLNDYLRNPRQTLKRLRKEKIKGKKGFIDWKKSAAREILLEDLEPPKGWLYGMDHLDAKYVYEYYLARYEETFEEVPFAQFETRYDEAIKKASKRRARSAEEEAMLEHDRLLHRRREHNHRGEPVFDMDNEAKTQLRKDIENNLHAKMKPMELHQSREVYMKYSLSKFRQKIYQYKRRAKFLNYLDKQRTEKRDEFVKTMTPKEVTFTRTPVAASVMNAPPINRIKAGNAQTRRPRSTSSRSNKRRRNRD